MRRRKKPIGRSGYFRVTASGEAAPVEQLRPDEKAEIEKHIVDIFLRSHTYFTGEPFFLSNPRQNAEDDFDFTVTSPAGDAFLELMEIAPLSKSGSGYEAAPPGYRAGDLATAITDRIFKKSKRYKKPKRELFLLLYLTHWAFALGTATIQLIRYKLSKRRHVFNAVFYLAPLDNEVGVLHWLYPVPPDFLFNFRPEDHENAFTLNLDYQKWQVDRVSSSPPQSRSSE
jgi:hypothetical protein